MILFICHQEELIREIDKGHEYIDDVFENSLTQQYLETIK